MSLPVVSVVPARIGAHDHFLLILLLPAQFPAGTIPVQGALPGGGRFSGTVQVRLDPPAAEAAQDAPDPDIFKGMHI